MWILQRLFLKIDVKQIYITVHSVLRKLKKQKMHIEVNYLITSADDAATFAAFLVGVIFALLARRVGRELLLFQILGVSIVNVFDFDDFFLFIGRRRGLCRCRRS